MSSLVYSSLAYIQLQCAQPSIPAHWLVYDDVDGNQQEQQDPRNVREMIQDAIAQEAPITRTRVKKMQELLEEVVAQETKYGDTSNKLRLQENGKWLNLIQVCVGDDQEIFGQN